MSSIVYQRRVLALAGMLQASHLVSSIARTGMASQDAMDSSLRSVFVLNPASISDVYAGTDGVRVGLKLAAEMLTGFDFREHADLLRYTFAVIALERKLATEPRLLRELGARIASVDERRHLNENGNKLLDEDTVAALAEVYESTLSQIEPRIRVSGRQNLLKHAINVNRIRALLLSAVRSAVLWHQVGGRRWQLALARGQMKQALEYIQ
ncbi:MAG: high frequency lysogenization protein HflD [Pseudomonadales bacterium]